jgi:hypothetical protein
MIDNGSKLWPNTPLRQKMANEHLEETVEQAFLQSGIRLVYRPQIPSIPEIKDVLYLLRYSWSPSPHFERVTQWPEYARNTHLVAAAVAQELLHCKGCHGDVAMARSTIARAIVALTAEEDRCLLCLPMVEALELATGESLMLNGVTDEQRRERCTCRACNRMFERKENGSRVETQSDCCLDH